jgi:hypothetical protein
MTDQSSVATANAATPSTSTKTDYTCVFNVHCVWSRTKKRNAKMTTNKPLPLLKADVLIMIYNTIAHNDVKRAQAAEALLETFSNQDIRRYWLKEKTRDMENELLSEAE